MATSRVFTDGSLDAQIKSFVVDIPAYLLYAGGKNNGLATFYIQIVDAAALPANGAVDHVVAPLEVLAGDEFEVQLPDYILFSSGICLYASSTQFTKTLIAASDMTVTVQYKAKTARTGA